MSSIWNHFAMKHLRPQIFYKHTDLLTSCGLLLMGLPQLTIPWLPSLELLCAAQFFIGAGQGILNTGNIEGLVQDCSNSIALAMELNAVLLQAIDMDLFRHIASPGHNELLQIDQVAVLTGHDPIVKFKWSYQTRPCLLCLWVGWWIMVCWVG